MNEELTNFLLRYVINNNPWIKLNDIQNYIALNDYDLLITFTDGTEMIFDTYSNTRSTVERNKINKEKDLKDQFRRQLNSLMKRRNITQEEMARRLKTTQPMIHRYLSGESIPNIITFKKMADILECSLDEFFYKYF